MDAAVELDVQNEAESSSTSGDGDGGKLLGDAPGKVAASTSSTSSGSSGESSSYLVGRADPVVVAEALGASRAKLIGGQVIGSLCFESRDRECEFLAEAGGSFCFPQMEKRLMNTGAANALLCAEDLALKSFVAARCARRQLEVDVGASSRVAELEEMVSALQKEKKDVEVSLASVRIRAEISMKQLDEAHDRAKAAEDVAKTAEEPRRGG